MAASAFDLLRSSRRRVRQAYDVTGGSSAAAAEGAGEVGGLTSETADICPLGPPLTPGVVGADERLGLWWSVARGGTELRYFPLLGAQWPPCAVHALPEDASVSAPCVALLTGLSHQHGAASRSAGPCAVAVCADLRLVVFPEGERVILPPPAGTLLGQVPAFVVPAAPHPAPGAIGIVLVVGTRTGRLFSLFLRQTGQRFEAEAGPLWPTTPSQVSLLGLLKRVRRSLGGGEPDALSAGAEAPRLAARSVEIVAPPAGDTDALFGALALGERYLAFYVHPRRCASGAELLWVTSMATLVGCGPQPQLLAARFCQEEAEGLLLLFTGEAPPGQREAAARYAAGDEEGEPRAALLARLAWPARGELPMSSASAESAVVVGPAPRAPQLAWGHGDGSPASSTFLAACGPVCVAAVRVRDQQFLLATVYQTALGLQVTEVQPVEVGILALALMAEGAAGRVAVITPHGLLDCPQRPLAKGGRSTAGLDKAFDEDAAVPSDPAVALRESHELFAAGREDQAASAAARAFAHHGAFQILRAVEKCTSDMLDASDTSGRRWKGVDEDVIVRHLLFDKSRDLHQWLAFLSECGVWTRLGGVQGAKEVRQAAAEACERVAVAQKLRELGDEDPEVFAGAIRRALQDADGEADGDSGGLSAARRFYGRPSACERLLSSLVDYPRSLPLGSSDVSNAVIFANGVAIAFLDAALDRRAQVIAGCPTLLPPPEPGQTRRVLPGSAQPPRGVGSGWLMSLRICRALEDLRLVNLEVIPVAPVQGLTLLDAQALRVAESLHSLCQASLRAASATFADLHCAPMAEFRHSVLRHLAEAESALAVHAHGPQRALLLAEEFEDLDGVVSLAAEGDPERLDGHMERSEAFRRHALAQFLHVRSLQPLFFRALRRFPPTPELLEELLAPYPELRWTLEVQSVGRLSAEVEWQGALERVQRRAAMLTARERQSAVKRDAFAALAAIVQKANGGEGEEEDATVSDLACLGRLQGISLRFGKSDDGAAVVGSKRPRTEAPPASAEECLVELGACIRKALPALRAEGSEGRLVADAARLVRLVERGLDERGVAPGPLLCGGNPTGAEKDVVAVRALQRLWAEVIHADAEQWRQALVAPAGAKRDALVASTGLHQMVAWRCPSRDQVRWSPPASADLIALCDAYPELSGLAPALRLAVEASGQR